ncbi:hypothetical protein [Ruminococcus sp. NK3A76]|uniref:hypothetical protein n=1 Tax=Ruminococcus sp. NK3A76 TaxID=877411 RepID=UPI00048E97BB|nr:hypothetical protein [Ruminococcus sp. NK3A76]
MTVGAIKLYRALTLSGTLLDGTWSSGETIIKTDGKTAEFYHDGVAESAVLSIYKVDDRLLADGEIGYRCELCFENRCERAELIYENHGGKVGLVVFDEEGNAQMFDRE